MAKETYKVISEFFYVKKEDLDLALNDMCHSFEFGAKKIFICYGNESHRQFPDNDNFVFIWVNKYNPNEFKIIINKYF